MLSRLRWHKFLSFCMFCFWLGSSTAAYAEGSSALGGNLLDQGEVAITLGGGFPDIILQFDFANSKQVNLAMRARINYNLGFPFFGFHAFVSAPIRISLYRKSKWAVALQLEPGAWIGGGAFSGSGIPYGLNLGFLMGASGIVSYRAHPKVDINWGLETQFIFGWEPAASSAFNFSRPTFGLQVPIEVFFGFEYNINENYSFFARIAAGPQIATGNLGTFLSFTGTGVTGSARFWAGVIWRR